MLIKQLGAGACATVSRLPTPQLQTALGHVCVALTVYLLTDGRPAGFCAAAANGTHRKPSCVVFVLCRCTRATTSSSGSLWQSSASMSPTR